MNHRRKPATGKILMSSAALSALLFSSCAMGPNYKRPEVAQPTAFKRATPNETARPAISKTWWTLFNDGQLNQLAEQTIAANQDIQAGIARVDEARAALRVARGDYFPSINLNPSMRRGRSAGTGFSATGISSGSTDTSNGNSSGNGTTTTSSSNGRISTSYSLPLVLNYEFDIWGRLRRQAEAAKANAIASETDLEFVRQTAIADVATAYFSIRLYDTQIEVYQRSLELFRRQLELTQTKLKAGLALQTDVLQAQTQVNSATSQVIEVQRARAKEEHAIAILLGKAPSEFSLEAKTLPPTIPLIPAGVPASLLNQRPDVATAEARLAAANANIGVATAAFYPTFSLTGSAGFESSRYQNLTDWANRVWSIGPGISLPIFQGGALYGTLQERRATYRELVANYRTAVLGAYRDVEDQLSDLHLLSQKAEVLDATVASAKEYSRLTELQYRQGISTYLQVIDANQTLLTNELSAAQAQNQRLAATVLLIKALGGGWENTAKL